MSGLPSVGESRADLRASTGALAIEPLDGVDTVAMEWRQLAERTGNLFGTWEWASTWWRHFGRDGQLDLKACRRRDGTLAAILPLYVGSVGPLKAMRFVGHGPADQLGPVCAPADRPGAADALARVVSDGPGRWDVFLAERLPAREAWDEQITAKVIRRESSPVLEIGGASWDEFLAQRSANFRSQIGRRERKLVREHGLRFRLTDRPAQLERDMETLFRLHAMRWGGASSGFTGTRAAFHRAFASTALERGWLRLWFAELDGEPVAAWHGFRFGGAEWYYQAGRDPAWDHSSVGFVLMAHSIREAFADGADEYKLLRGGEEYKSRFSTTEQGVDTLAAGSTMAGRAAIAALAARKRLPLRARRWLDQRLG